MTENKQKYYIRATNDFNWAYTLCRNGIPLAYSGLKSDLEELTELANNHDELLKALKSCSYRNREIDYDYIQGAINKAEGK
jgi:hypothetical protein